MAAGWSCDGILRGGNKHRRESAPTLLLLTPAWPAGSASAGAQATHQRQTHTLVSRAASGGQIPGGVCVVVLIPNLCAHHMGMLRLEQESPLPGCVRVEGSDESVGGPGGGLGRSFWEMSRE